jgi:hypothetical protein
MSSGEVPMWHRYRIETGPKPHATKLYLLKRPDANAPAQAMDFDLNDYLRLID